MARKVIVAGTRDFVDWDFVRRKLDHYLPAHCEIVSGRARGADKLGERYAKRYNLPLALFPADWETYGNAAGLRRNEDMAKYADACIVFWDGVSRGTLNMIHTAIRYGLQLRIIKYKRETLSRCA